MNIKTPKNWAEAGAWLDSDELEEQSCMPHLGSWRKAANIDTCRGLVAYRKLQPQPRKAREFWINFFSNGDASVYHKEKDGTSFTLASVKERIHVIEILPTARSWYINTQQPISPGVWSCSKEEDIKTIEEMKGFVELYEGQGLYAMNVITSELRHWYNAMTRYTCYREFPHGEPDTPHLVKVIEI